MFPGHPNASGKLVGTLRASTAAKAIVAEGWPSLLQAMEAGEINTPRRIAAFLTTLVFESWCEYSALQAGDRFYTGRGYIQLTGDFNYASAEEYLGVDLTSTPEARERARSLEWSAKIALWYWTVARRNCNAYADALRMGKINAAIGYPLAGSNDADRCMVFQQALRQLTGKIETVDCAR